jgi:formylglycine-generating enzyme required for sulfatase activity
VLAADPLHLGTWTEALRPAAAALVPPLSDVFRSGKSVERRHTAAEVLLAWTAEQPEVLAGLLLDADEHQFVKLWPQVASHGKASLALVRQEMRKQATFDWKDAPLPPGWGTAPDGAMRRIEQAGGILAERFALCQSLPLEELVPLVEELRRLMYRPIRLRPYTTPDGLRAAAVWARDDRDWQAAVGLTAEEVCRQEVERRAKGWQPVDVAGYPNGDQARYAVLFVRGGKGEDSRLYVGVAEDDHEKKGWGPLRQQKRNPVTMQVFQPRRGPALLSGVWRLDVPRGDFRAIDDEASHGGRGLTLGLPVDVSLSELSPHIQLVRSELLAQLSGSPWVRVAWHYQHEDYPHPQRRYTGCFAGSAAFDHISLLGLTPQQQQQRGRELAAQGYRPAALAAGVVGGEVVTASVWHRPVVPDQAKESLAKRQANAAVALLRHDEAATVWPLLQHRRDPRLRSYLIARLGPQGADFRTIVERMQGKPELSEKRALILCLGDFGSDVAPAEERAALVEWLQKQYRDDPDSGVHGAAEWLLRQWKQEERLRQVDAELQKRDADAARGEKLPPGGRRWYVNGQGQTMVVLVDPPEFVMGTPRSEVDRVGGPEGDPQGNIENQHRRRIGRSFAIAAKEVTVEEFLRFRADHVYSKKFTPPGGPVDLVDWYLVAEYCNWLSKREGLPQEEWCYLPNDKNEFAEGMRLRPNWHQLRGYRLPTEAEWEQACRAGAVTSRYYGETDELMGRYAWYTKVSQNEAMLPPGSLRPNDLGLFDMLGNALEWVQDGITYYPDNNYSKPSPDIGQGRDLTEIGDRGSRLLRGGSFDSDPLLLRSGVRVWYSPRQRYSYIGARIARSYR